jgi:hypothetical protein
MDSIGHTLQIRKSTINHPQAGNGVFINSPRPVPPGTLLGFFPGVIYNKDAIHTIKIEARHQTELPYLVRHNGNAVYFNETLLYPPHKLGFCMEEYLMRINRLKKQSPMEAYPPQINPYALGHLINHPPPGTAANVCLIDFEIPDSFFPSYLLTHLPYMKYSKNPSSPPKYLQAVGVISLQYLQDQELFVNYGTERFPDNFTPKWLQDPPDNLPIANYLCKDDCLYEFSRVTKFLLKWDEFSLTEIEKLQNKMQEDREKMIKEAMEDPKMFEKYYKK